MIIHLIFFLENNNDAYMADKKNDYIFFTKNFHNEANTVKIYEKIVVIISCNLKGEDKTL